MVFSASASTKPRTLKPDLMVSLSSIVAFVTGALPVYGSNEIGDS